MNNDTKKPSPSPDSKKKVFKPGKVMHGFVVKPLGKPEKKCNPTKD